MTPSPSPQGEVVDLFCGVGALSHGLHLAGFEILAGYDLDPRCKYAFETNNRATFFTRDVATLTPKEIRNHYSGNSLSILAGCAPCQPFSTYQRRYAEDPRWSLVSVFGELAASVLPDIVTMENVPALLNYKSGEVFQALCQQLEEAHYFVSWTVAKCEEYGVPQRRRRLVLIASRTELPNPLLSTHTQPLTVRDAIGTLPPISAGEVDLNDPLHTSQSLNETNLQRIRASKPGGTWRDWPTHLRANCHRRTTGKTYPAVYGRMVWNQPSPTITTQCYGFGNGRFGHPEQDRALSLREAALLQSFPQYYDFLPTQETPNFSEMGKWIGNAVPVRLAEAIGSSLHRKS